MFLGEFIVPLFSNWFVNDFFSLSFHVKTKIVSAMLILSILCYIQSFVVLKIDVNALLQTLLEGVNALLRTPIWRWLCLVASIILWHQCFVAMPLKDITALLQISTVEDPWYHCSVAYTTLTGMRGYLFFLTITLPTKYVPHPQNQDKLI